MNIEMLEHLLLYSTLSKLKVSKKRYKNVGKPLTNFGLEFDEQVGFTGHGPNCENFFFIVKPGDLTGDLNDALICKNKDAANHHESFYVSHCYRVPLKQLRGLPFNSYPIAQTSYYIKPQREEAEVHTVLFYYMPRGDVAYHDFRWADNWVVVRRWNAGTFADRDSIVEGPRFGKFPLGERDLEINAHIQCHLGHQFSIRYDWCVLIGFEELPKLKLSVNPRAVRRLFEIKAIKDPVEGRKRLIHWVTEHQRKAPPAADSAAAEAAESDMDEWVHVCEHLRGYYEFEWKGLNCWLIPSEYHRERLPAHTKHAEIWK